MVGLGKAGSSPPHARTGPSCNQIACGSGLKWVVNTIRPNTNSAVSQRVPLRREGVESFEEI